jgi:hypothetical protein
MSDQKFEAVSAEEIAALIRICAKIKVQCAALEINDIPDEAITTAVTAATMLYSTATHECGRNIEALLSSEVNATSVVVTVKAMLHAVGLSSFDLAMWANRSQS